MKMQALRNRVESLGWCELSPCWVANERLRTAGAAEGISGRVIFAACWAGMPKKAFAKIATPRLHDSQVSSVFLTGLGFSPPKGHLQGADT